MSIVWLALIVIFLIVEIATVGLTSIWLAGGALAALVVELLGLGIVWQIAAFLIVTFILLYFTRPWAQKYLNAKSVKTNYESLIGQKIKMTEQVDNLSQTGKAVVNGQEWTVRAEADGDILEPGDFGEVLRVEGVKLIVKENLDKKRKYGTMLYEMTNFI